MPKLGAEPIRKAALINAAIAQVGQAGSLDVTVARIARAAGMSPALAHHYFGSKEQIFLAAMRHILRSYGVAVRARLAGAATPRARLEAIMAASFGPQNFQRETISAWLHFYAMAQINPDAARLLRVYHRRLTSNLMVALRPLCAQAGGEPPGAARIAATLAALIDGVYLRAALDPDASDAEAAIATLTDYLNEVLP